MSDHQHSEEKIRARAYEIYLQRGAQPGHERDDWMQAEYDLRQLPSVQLPPPLPRLRAKIKPA